MKSKIARLAREVAARSGLDFTKYQRPELVERLVNFFGFPQYAFLIIIVPVLVLFVVTLAAVAFVYFRYSGQYLLVLVVGGFGLWCTLSSGIPLGLRNLAKRVVQDASGLVDGTLDITLTVLRDRFRLREHLPSPGDMLRGISLIAILPALQAALRKKFGFIAVLLRWPVNRVFYTIAANGGELLDTALHRSAGVKRSNLANTPPPATSPSLWEAESTIDASRRKILRIAENAATGFSIPFLALFCWNTLVNVLIGLGLYFGWNLIFG